mmetsp:Transcript_22562/g.53608  ORF Transcript_22562/g.53608 Transcript_22562/m.53608 type:complete len:215 (-) Transcript_22562:2-646(-)
MSSMRSASSNTRYDTCPRLIWLLSRKSFSRPGVAMTACAPLRRSRSCPPLGAPPYTHVDMMLELWPNLTVSSWICVASSRVGASTRMIGPWRGSLRGPLFTCWNPGKRNPSVLPEPVFATPTQSRPCSAAGHVCDCTIEGSVYPARLMHAMMGGGIGASSKLRNGSGQPPATVISCFARHARTCSLSLSWSGGMFEMSSVGPRRPPPPPPPPPW